MRPQQLAQYVEVGALLLERKVLHKDACCHVLLTRCQLMERREELYPDTVEGTLVYFLVDDVIRPRLYYRHRLFLFLGY